MHNGVLNIPVFLGISQQPLSPSAASLRLSQIPGSYLGGVDSVFVLLLHSSTHLMCHGEFMSHTC